MNFYIHIYYLTQGTIVKRLFQFVLKHYNNGTKYLQYSYYTVNGCCDTIFFKRSTFGIKFRLIEEVSYIVVSLFLNCKVGMALHSARKNSNTIHSRATESLKTQSASGTSHSFPAKRYILTSIIKSIHVLKFWLFCKMLYELKVTWLVLNFDIL